MIKRIVYFFLTLFVLASCKNSKQTEPEKESPKTDTTSFIPAIELIKADADNVMDIPYYLYIKSTDVLTNKVIDSVALSRQDFKKIITPVLQIDLTSKSAKEKFKESTFQDLTTKSITSIISTNDVTENVKNITTLLDDEKNLLKNSYITIISSSKDTSFTKKYFWKANKSLTITTTASINNKVVKDIKQFINWNDKAE